MRRPLEDESQADWFSVRRSWHPASASFSPSRCGCASRFEDFPFTRTYVKALQEPRPVTAPGRAPGTARSWRAAEHAKTSQAWRYREIDTDHMIPINRPAELVARAAA